MSKRVRITLGNREAEALLALVMLGWADLETDEDDSMLPKGGWPVVDRVCAKVYRAAQEVTA
jgi:hypothetical protein